MLASPLARSLARPLAHTLVPADYLRPFIRTINFTGGSIIDYTNINSTSKRFFVRGPVTQAMGLAKGTYFSNWNATGTSYGFTQPGTYEFGSFGASTPQIQANHLSEINAAPADLVFLYCGLNDLGNGSATASLTFSRIQTFVAALRSAGHQNIAIAGITPRRSTYNPTGTDGKTIAVRNVETNDLLRPWCASQGIPFCDWYSVLNDGSGFLRTDLSIDETHPNTLGAQKMGEFLHSFILSNYRTAESPYGSALQATLNPESDFTAGWSNSQFGSGGSATHTTVAATDGLGSWRRITTNNPVLLTNTSYSQRSNVPIPAAWGHVDGQLLQPIIELRMLSEGTTAISADINNGGTSPINCFNLNNVEVHQPFHSVYFGQPFAANASTLFQFTMAIRGSIALDIRRFGFRKVTSMVPPFI
jgi:lysophospholipase L1-like esterase